MKSWTLVLALLAALTLAASAGADESAAAAIAARLPIISLPRVGFDLPEAGARGAALVHRRIQKIQRTAHYLFGFASTFPNIADRSVWVDALDF